MAEPAVVAVVPSAPPVRKAAHNAVVKLIALQAGHNWPRDAAAKGLDAGQATDTAAKRTEAVGKQRAAARSSAGKAQPAAKKRLRTKRPAVEEDDEEEKEEEEANPRRQGKQQQKKKEQQAGSAQKEQSESKRARKQAGASLPAYVSLEQNVYVGGEKRHRRRDSGGAEECACQWHEGVCGDSSCVNRAVFVECGPHDWIGDIPGELRSSCGNQRFAKRQYARVVPFPTEKKGWGLLAGEDIECGQFIIEYVGEVIGLAEVLRRMKEEGDRRHHYFMSLDSGSFIDASRKGNLSRFINHSCAPNAVTQTWTVDGRPRIGIFALYDIPKGFEITFDYQFETMGKQRQACHCGEDACRGYIGTPPQGELRENRELLENSKLWNRRQFEDPLVPLKPPALLQARHFIDWETRSRTADELPAAACFLRRNVVSTAAARARQYLQLLASVGKGKGSGPCLRKKNSPSSSSSSSSSTSSSSVIIPSPLPAAPRRPLDRRAQVRRCAESVARLWRLNFALDVDKQCGNITLDQLCQPARPVRKSRRK